jgi:hypothetical protein
VTQEKLSVPLRAWGGIMRNMSGETTSVSGLSLPEHEDVESAVSSGV